MSDESNVFDQRDAVLSVENLTIAYPGRSGRFVAVDDLSFCVASGEILGIVGESGAGKSTISAAITQLIDYPGVLENGAITLNGANLLEQTEAELCHIRAAEIGTIFQDPLTALNPVLSIGSQMIRAIRLSSDLDHVAARERAIQLIDAMGIPDASSRLPQYPHQFSGGMRQRLVIAIAIAGRPSLLIADEPTTALDVSIQSKILKIIQGLVREQQLGVILITHDMATISEIADRVVVMRYGKLVESGTTNQIINAPVHDYTRALVQAVPRTDIKLHRFTLVEETNTAVHSMELAESSESSGSSPSDAPELMLELRNLSKSYVTRRAIFRRNYRRFTALDNVSLDIQRGEVFGLVGESGSGKSTIARILCGLETADSGRIFYEGEDITALDVGGAARRKPILDTQMVFQDPYSSLNPRQRIADLLIEPLLVHGQTSRQDGRQIVANMMRSVGLSDADSLKYPHQFSGGQRQRICIARALIMKPKFLICDEPTSALDVAIQAQILNLLKDLRDKMELTILFISHDLAVIRQMCDRIAVLKAGKLCELADAETLFEQASHPYTRQLLANMPKFSRHNSRQTPAASPC